MIGRRHAYLLTLAIALAGSADSGPARAETDIGQVQAVVSAAHGTPPERVRRPLYRWDDIFPNEIVETSRDSALHLRFLDQSVFRLGADSRATLDRYVYDPASGSGELTLNLKEGIFRIKTGEMKKEGVRVVTPVAVITVSGTDFIVAVLSTLIRIAVLDGEVSVAPSAPGAPSAALAAPARAQIDSRGEVTPYGGSLSDPNLDDGVGVGRGERNGSDSSRGPAPRSPSFD